MFTLPSVWKSTTEKLELITRYFADFTPEQLAQLVWARSGLYQNGMQKSMWSLEKTLIKYTYTMYLHSLKHCCNCRMGTQAHRSLILAVVVDFLTVPLAIFFPEVQFYAVDSIAKKLKVVDAVCEMVGIKNIETKHTRVEDIKNKKFDYAVSRAVAPIKGFMEMGRPCYSLKNQINPMV